VGEPGVSIRIVDLGRDTGHVTHQQGGDSALGEFIGFLSYIGTEIIYG
jgi:hypothetical protein